MNKKTMKYLQGPVIYVLLLVLVLWFVSMIGAPKMEEPEELSYSELLEWVEADLKADEGLSDDTSKTISDVIIVQNQLVARTEDSDISQSEFSTARYDLYATIPSEEQFYADVNEIYKSVLNRESISPTEYTFNSRSQLPAGTPWWLEFLPYLVLIVVMVAFWFFLMRQQTGGGKGVVESIGTDKTFSSKYGANNCPDKSANSMFSYAKGKGCAWGTMDSLPEVPGIALCSDGHVGVYVGGGFAVEERSFSDGCVKTCVKDRSWTHWYYLPFIDYGEAGNVKPPQMEYALGSRLLTKGTEGNDVKQLQEYLLQLGYSLPKFGADGDFGAETEAAMRVFQTAEGLDVDGKYGEKSHAALMDALSADDEAPEPPAQPEDGGEENDAEKPVRSHVVIVSEGGKVNIRVGNGTQYGRITQLAPGTTLDYVATAQNGWNAVVVNARVGWVSGEYSRVI